MHSKALREVASGCYVKGYSRKLKARKILRAVLCYNHDRDRDVRVFDRLKQR